MKLSVLLTLDGLGQQQGFVDGIAKEFDASNVGSQMRNNPSLNIQLTISASFPESSRDRESDDAVEGRHRGSSIEENNRGAEALNEGHSRGGFGVVGHAEISMQGAMRQASKLPAQDYGAAQAQPSNQGQFRAKMDGAAQGYASRTAQMTM